MNKKLKEGVSVQELENFGKKHLIVIALIVYFLLATLLTFLFFGATWSIFLAGIGAIIGILLPKKIEKAAAGAFQAVCKQAKMTKIVIGVIGAAVSFFLPPVIFFVLGLMGGSSILGATSFMGTGKKNVTIEEVEKD